jgi:hypothetical protein
MIITPQLPNIPYQGINPPADSLRRDNSMREPIPQPADVKAYPQEKPIGEGDRIRNTNAGTEQNVQENRQQSEQARTTINDNDGQQGQQQGQSKGDDGSGDTNAQQGRSSQSGGSNDAKPTPEELQREQLIKELVFRDKEVRAHERAHDSAGGSYTGSPSYVLQRGPDGKSYAIGGEVSVDMASIPGDPKATIQKMQRVRAAALAPASPSVQDQKVAASAQRIIAQMQMQVLNESKEGFRAGTTSVNPSEYFDNIDGSDGDSQLKNVEEAVYSSNKPSQQLQSVEDTVYSFQKAPTRLNTVEEAVFGFDEPNAKVREFEVLSRSLRIENFYHQTSQVNTTNLRITV